MVTTNLINFWLYIKSMTASSMSLIALYAVLLYPHSTINDFATYCIITKSVTYAMIK